MTTPITLSFTETDLDALAGIAGKIAVIVPPDVLSSLEAAVAKMQAAERIVLDPARRPGFDFDAFEAAWQAFEKARV